MDMPPHGQPASSHFDGIATKATIRFDTTTVVQDGTVVLESIKDDAAAILADRDQQLASR